MHPLESIEVVSNLLEHLMGREEPMVQKLAPNPGSRAERFGQLLCPDLHPLEATGGQEGRVASARPESDLAQRVDRLEAEILDLRKALLRIEAVLADAAPPARDDDGEPPSASPAD